MKQRTQVLATIIMIFCGLGLIGAMISFLVVPTSPQAIAELVGIFIVLAAALAMKNALAIGWWVLIILSSCLACMLLVITFIALIEGTRIEPVMVPASLALLAAVPALLLITDPPSRWT